MISVADALALILTETRPLARGRVPLAACLGYVAAEDVTAPFDSPPFPNSAVDGFAVRSADLQAASTKNPIRLQVAAESRAGSQPIALPAGPCCIRQMTGAPIPRGADAVVMKEDVGDAGGGTVVFSETALPGDHVRPDGQDIRRGETAIAAGAVIRASEVAMLACLGRSEVSAFPQPRIALCTTGDEIVEPGIPLQPGQIYNSNRYMLSALLRSSGFTTSEYAHLPDTLDGTSAGLERSAAGCHVIITSGGVSVGDHDHVRAALEQLGIVKFWRVAMKPGKPLLYGRIGETHFFGLPGNPVSSMVSFELFVRPALRRLAGHSRLHRPIVRARLASALHHRPGREEYARASTTRAGEEFIADPHPGQGSNMVSSMVASNSLAVIPAEAGSLPEGARVDVLMTEWPEE